MGIPSYSSNHVSRWYNPPLCFNTTCLPEESRASSSPRQVNILSAHLLIYLEDSCLKLLLIVMLNTLQSSHDTLQTAQGEWTVHTKGSFYD